jgi:RNA polymerase sigma-70 factor (ECF subfamily)
LPSEQETSDQSLLRRFREGQQDAATTLYVRYAKRLEALARAQTGQALAARFDAEDVVQSVFRTFFRRASQGFYDIPAGEELWQLLLVLALNKVRALAVHHRAQKRDAGRTISEDGLQTTSVGQGCDESLAYRSLQIALDEVLHDFPESARRVVEMRIEGYEIKEISEQTNRSKRTVERTLQQVRQRLTRLIDHED